MTNMNDLVPVYSREELVAVILGQNKVSFSVGIRPSIDEDSANMDFKVFCKKAT